MSERRLYAHVLRIAADIIEASPVDVTADEVIAALRHRLGLVREPRPNVPRGEA